MTEAFHLIERTQAFSRSLGPQVDIEWSAGRGQVGVEQSVGIVTRTQLLQPLPVVAGEEL